MKKEKKFQEPIDFDKNKRDTMIRDEFNSRRPQEKVGEIMEDLGKKHYLSRHTIDQIIYKRKNT